MCIAMLVLTRGYDEHHNRQASKGIGDDMIGADASDETEQRRRD